MQTQGTQRPWWAAAGLLAAVGLFLVITGPALALLALFTGAAGDQAVSPSGSDLLATMHVIGLLAGVAGGALLLVGLVWWLYGAVRRGRHRREQTTHT